MYIRKKFHFTIKKLCEICRNVISHSLKKENRDKTSLCLLFSSKRTQHHFSSLVFQCETMSQILPVLKGKGKLLIFIHFNELRISLAKYSFVLQ